MMFYPTALLVVTVMMVGGIFSRWQEKKEPDLDQQVLDQLKKAGSDLSQPHNTEFFLYFPTEELANKASKNIVAEGCEVMVQVKENV